NLLLTVALAVAAVPEGLPAAITVALAISLKIIAKHQAIVKKLSAVETLGSISAICADKTGTLTKNELTVKSLLLPDDFHIHLHGSGYDPRDARLSYWENSQKFPLNKDQFSDQLARLMGVFVFCNNAKLYREQAGYKVLGDPTEGALLTAAAKFSHFFKYSSPSGKRLLEIPFSSHRKMMSVLLKAEGKISLLSKGAFAVLIKRCAFYYEGGEIRPLSAGKIKDFERQQDYLAKKGMRVLAFAYKTLDSMPRPLTSANGAALEEGLVYLGLAGLIDPPRVEIKEHIAACQKAGIKIYVITGDHALTAQTVAEELGIARRDKSSALITGERLDQMDDASLIRVLSKPNAIFARSDPIHKLRIVSALQRMGERVAVTGDGVNDTPALRKADIGVAMGITGTDAAKEAADMVLLNDNFASIVETIRQARRTYENMKKFIWFNFSTNIGEIVLIVLALMISLSSPLTAILVLLVNLGTDMFPAIALSLEPEEEELLLKPPRQPEEKILNPHFVAHFTINGVFIGLMALLGYINFLKNNGWFWGERLPFDDPLAVHGTTLAFALLVFMELANSLNAKSFQTSLFSGRVLSNRYLWGSIMISAVLVLLVVYTPYGQSLFGTSALGLADWGLILLFSLFVIGFEELRKFGLKLFPIEKRGE
ncbi:MAG: cation-transporting P-type ATPase, partial [Parcubacteria group bacterium]|nr:cation-transporting P-type ATPase [Parcubacteria group bacterium]